MKVKLDAMAFAPIRAHRTDAGMDILSPVTTLIKAHESVTIDTGVHIELPHQTVGLLKSKSGLNTLYGIVGEGVIDEGYTGSIRVKLYNNSNNDYVIARGNKIIQLVIVPCLYSDVEIVDELEGTDRGNNGFGSTGK